MMTAPTPLLDLASLAALPCCAATLHAKGQHPRYLADAAARHYAHRDLAALEHDLGRSLPDGATIAAGIGTLTLLRHEVLWNPVHVAPQSDPAPARRLASAELQSARLAACVTCGRLGEGGCEVAGCRCTGMGDPTALLSRCPLNRWPDSEPI